MALKRARRKANGLVELPEVTCGRCRTTNLGVRSDGVFYCWRCGKGGRTTPPVGNISPSPLLPAVSAETSYNTELSGIPLFARKMIERRGFDPVWLESQYRVRWNGQRLHWPCGAGASLRSIWAWESPKALTVAPRGLIGQHLLHPGAHVIIVEGDYKAAAIPLPWTGVGLMGTAMTADQAQILLGSRPASIGIMLDGGCGEQAQNIRISLAPTPAVVYSLPMNCGPDDIDRGELTRLLMEGA